MKKTAAWLVRHALEQIGVPYTFGIPGVHNIELYDELRESETILPLLVTHEGGAAFMADAVYRASGQVGVLMVVPAAGLTHAMSGIGEAYLDGIPMLVISGGVRTDLEQGFQLHEVDQQALMRTLTKATFKIESYDEAVATVYRAWRTANCAVGGDTDPEPSGTAATSPSANTVSVARIRPSVTRRPRSVGRPKVSINGFGFTPAAHTTVAASIRSPSTNVTSTVVPGAPCRRPSIACHRRSSTGATSLGGASSRTRRSSSTRSSSTTRTIQPGRTPALPAVPSGSTR